MAIPSIYINLEDDVSKITERIKRQRSPQLVLVCPRRCFLFSDSINLRLLKKQTDLLGKEIFILTMDERGQIFAKEAGFGLKFLPKAQTGKSFSDIQVTKKPQPAVEDHAVLPPDAENQNLVVKTLNKVFAPKTEIAEAPAVDQASSEPQLSPEAEAQEILAKQGQGISDGGINQSLNGRDAIFPDELMQLEPAAVKPRHLGRLIGLFAAACMVLLLVLVFLVLPQANVLVYPKTEPVSRDMDITFSTSIKAADAAKLAIPGQSVSEVIQASSTFQSQGKQQVGNKAEGTVKIYNFTKVPINLKAATTVLTVGGKTYSLTQDVLGLKPTTYSNSRTKEVDPNSLGDSVGIQASDGGEDYNLPVGMRLEISNQVFGSKPQLLYAKADTEISGGTTRYLSVVSESDMQTAQQQLQEQALSLVRQKLASQGLIMPDSAYNLSGSNFSSTVPVGSQSQNFQASLTVTIQGLAFSSDDLTKLVDQRISETLSSNKTLQNQTDLPKFTVKSWDNNNQLAVMSVHYQGLAIYNLSVEDLPGKLVGKSESQVNDLLKNKSNIDKVDITLAPAWQTRFPFFSSKIQVKVAK